MRFCSIECLGAFAAACLSLPAQVPTGYIPVTATRVQDATGAPASGTVSAQIVLSGQSVGSSSGGGGQITLPPVNAPIVNGAFSINLPNTYLSHPQNLCIAITATDQYGQQILGPGYECVQPTSVTNYWCSASGCDFDLYVPNTAAVAPLATGPAGPRGLTGSTVPLTDENISANTTALLSSILTQQVISNVNVKTLSGLSMPEYLSSARPPLASWIRAMHTAGPYGFQQKIAILSDSTAILDINNGNVGPDLSSQRWAEQVRTYLQSNYGSGGMEIPVIHTVQATAPNQDYFTMTGTSGGVLPTDCRFGPQQSVAPVQGCTVLKMSAGQTLNFLSPVAWDTLAVKGVIDSSSHSLTVTIDGTAAGSVLSGSPTTASPVRQAVASVTLGTHAASFTCSATPCYIYSVEAVAGIKGIEFLNLSVGGATSSFWIGSTAFVFYDLTPSPLPALNVIDFLTNDALVNTAPATYASNVATILAHGQSGLTGIPRYPSTLIKVAAQSVGAGYQHIPVLRAALLPVALATGSDVVDLQSRWGVTPFTGGSEWTGTNTDYTHPGRAGNNDIAAMILAKIVDAPVTAPPIPGSYPLWQSNSTAVAPPTAEVAEVVFVTSASSTVALPIPRQTNVAAVPGSSTDYTGFSHHWAVLNVSSAAATISPPAGYTMATGANVAPATKRDCYSFQVGTSANVYCF